jgi:hypothetical protein
LKLLSFSPGETGVSPLDSVMTSSSELPQMRRILPASHYDEFRFSFQGPSVSSVADETRSRRSFFSGAEVGDRRWLGSRILAGRSEPSCFFFALSFSGEKPPEVGRADAQDGTLCLRLSERATPFWIYFRSGTRQPHDNAAQSRDTRHGPLVGCEPACSRAPCTGDMAGTGKTCAPRA